MHATFTEIEEYYEANRTRPMTEWLRFETTFDNPGKQGLVGLLSLQGDACPPHMKGTKIVFKISQYINHLVQHEYTVMKSLTGIAEWCPYYCRAIGSILSRVDSTTRKTGNPFEISGTHPIEKEVLLCEYIENSNALSRYMRSKHIDDRVIYSTIKQVLMAITIAQRMKKFTHYDLHSGNIMIRKCSKHVVFLYVLDDESQYCIPTHGRYPVIIDYGFSYSSDMEGGPAWASMAHTDVGFMSDRFDPVADPKLFLLTVSHEIKHLRKNRNAKIFRNVARNLYGSLKCDADSGWDNVDKMGASDYVTKMLGKCQTTSLIFTEYEHYAIDILQTLVILPLERQSYEKIELSYMTFVAEFVKIEKEVGRPYYNLYILKGIVDVAREVAADYAAGIPTAVLYFSRSVQERINVMADYCTPEDIHWEKMLCSVLCLARNIEGVMYDVVSTRMREKERRYDKLPTRTIEATYGIVEANLPSEYEFSRNTAVYVIDVRKGSCSPMHITDRDIRACNNMHSLNWGSYLQKIKEYHT